MTLEEALEILHETLNQCGKDNPTFYGAIAVKVALDYIENESIPKERIREMIAEEIANRNELPESAIETRTMHEYTRATLQELLEE